MNQETPASEDQSVEIESISIPELVIGALLIAAGLIGSFYSFLTMNGFTLSPQFRISFALSGIIVCLGVLAAAHGWTSNIFRSVALSFLTLAFYIYFSFMTF